MSKLWECFSRGEIPEIWPSHCLPEQRVRIRTSEPRCHTTECAGFRRFSRSRRNSRRLKFIATNQDLKGNYMSKKPTHADAHVILELYNLRREPEMRKARAWWLGEFWPNSVEDFTKVSAAMGTQENHWMRP